jgi:hypothetical protein
MPNKQSSRTRIKRKTNGMGSLTSAAPVWAVGASLPEIKTYATQGANYQLYHNTPVSMANSPNLLDGIIQGVNQASRIGNRITLRRLRVRIVFNNKIDRPNVSYRVAVTAAPVSTNADTFGELFNGGGITGTHVRPNSQLLYDTVFPLNQGSGMVTPNKERSFNHAFEIPFNHPVVYSTADGKATTNLTVWFVAFDAYGTLITDNIASRSGIVCT